MMMYARHLGVAILLLVLAVPCAWGQRNDLGDRSDIYLSSQQRPVDIVLGSVYQTYTDGTGEEDLEISELSTPVALFVPVGRSLGLSVLASYATVSGDGLETVSGVTDVKLGASFYQRIGAGSLVLSTGVSVPVGATEFTQEEYPTVIAQSLHVYNFRVPGYGQGFSVAPGFTFAYPISEGVVLGVGASYQLRSSYRPTTILDADYQPGDELLVTGGFDVRLSQTLNFSADVTYTTYDADTIEETEVFNAGDKLTATGQLLGRFGFNEMRLLARYRSPDKSTIPPTASTQQPRSLQTIPTELFLMATYRQQVARRFSIGVLGQARLFEEAAFYDAVTLIDVGLLPTIGFSDSVALELRGVYTTGDIEGFEAGGGLAIRL